MIRYLLDTNICIYIINKRPAEVYTKFKKIKLDNIYISSITDFELRYGVQKSSKFDHNSKALDEFLGYLNIIPFDSDAAQIAAGIRLVLEKQGNLIGPYDLLIASQAISKQFVLVTNNEKEFKRIKDLKIENWFS